MLGQISEWVVTDRHSNSRRRRPNLYSSDSNRVSWRAISMGWRVMRSKVSVWPRRLMCHSMGGGGLSKVMLWLTPLDWVCIFLLMILLIDSTHFLIDLPEEVTRDKDLFFMFSFFLSFMTIKLKLNFAKSTTWPLSSPYLITVRGLEVKVWDSLNTLICFIVMRVLVDTQCIIYTSQLNLKLDNIFCTIT